MYTHTHTSLCGEEFNRETLLFVCTQNLFGTLKNMDAFANVPNHQKQEFMEHLEAEQMRESLRYIVI